jgi:hypothetical protein
MLRPAGFRKKVRNWRLETPETVAVVNLQRSRWGETYFLNFGILVKAIEVLTDPKHYQCHARIRLPELMPDRLRGHALFDLSDSTIDPAEREKEIADAIRAYGFPLLQRCGTVAGLRDAITERPLLAHATALRRLVGQIK